MTEQMSPTTVREYRRASGSRRRTRRRNGALLRVLTATGARRGEVCGLRWSDLDAAAGTITGTFSRICQRAGLNGVRLHDLRHLHATQLLAAGVPVRTVSGRLGHANAATTLNVYAHFLEEIDRAAAEVIGGLLQPPSD